MLLLHATGSLLQYAGQGGNMLIIAYYFVHLDQNHRGNNNIEEYSGHFMILT